MKTKATIKQTEIAIDALADFNKDYKTAWDFGMNWDSRNVTNNGLFDTYINHFLFPKLNEQWIIDVPLGNRFDFLAKEVDFVGQYNEEYVIKDAIPIAMNLSKPEELALKRHYPEMITRYYGDGIVKKQKFTLNNNDIRRNYSTLGQMVGFAISVYNKRISDINVLEEKEIKAMIVEYATNHTLDRRPVTSEQELFSTVFDAILNIQNNSEKYNESSLASNGQIGRYTTTTKLEDVVILTTDSLKRFFLDTKLANTFQVAGLDLSQRIISFDDLGGVYKTTADITIANAETIAAFRAYGDYQIAIGDVIESGVVFTFDVSGLTEFTGKVVEIKPEDTELFAYVLDLSKIRYRRYTRNMLKIPFYNGEYDEITYWIHYYSFKAMSPFYNNILVSGTV